MLIGTGGYVHAGKDATADFLVEDHAFDKRFFSWGVNEALLLLDPWLPFCTEMADIWPDQCDFLRYTDLFAMCGGYGAYEYFKENPEVRRLMQKMGTEVGRNMFGQQVWVELLDKECAGLLADGHDVAVTGVRYPNEIAWVRSRSGRAVWVNRPGFGPVNSHSSDNSLGPDDFDAVIENDGTLADLRKKVSQYVAAA